MILDALKFRPRMCVSCGQVSTTGCVENEKSEQSGRLLEENGTSDADEHHPLDASPVSSYSAPITAHRR